MKVVVSNESGELFSWTGESDLKGIFPTAHEKPAVLAALEAATKYLNTAEDTTAAEPIPPAPEAPAPEPQP